MREHYYRSVFQHVPSLDFPIPFLWFWGITVRSRRTRVTWKKSKSKFFAELPVPKVWARMPHKSRWRFTLLLANAEATDDVKIALRIDFAEVVQQSSSTT